MNTLEPIRFACRSDKIGGCAECSLAYDCQSRRQGRPAALPIVMLVLFGVVAQFFV